jgi:hypothetical protein
MSGTVCVVVKQEYASARDPQFLRLFRISDWIVIDEEHEASYKAG